MTHEMQSLEKPFYIPKDVWLLIEPRLKNGFSYYKEPEKSRLEQVEKKLFNSIIFNTEQEYEVKKFWELLSQSNDCFLLYTIIHNFYTLNLKIILDYYKQSKERGILDKKIKSLVRELKKPTYIANIPDLIDAQVTKNGEVFSFLAYLEHARAQINQSDVGVHGSAYESFNKVIAKTRESNHLHFFIRSFAFEVAEKRKEGMLLDFNENKMKEILSLCLPLLFSDTPKKKNKNEAIDDWDKVIADTLRRCKIDW